MPVGIPLEAFAPNDDGGEPLILGMLRPDRPRRRPELMVELFRELAGRDDVHAMLFGAERPAGVGPTPGLQFLGPLAPWQVSAFLGQADIYVDGSECQAFGLPNLEAMASGCAVIGPEEGGWRELAGEVGITVGSSKAELLSAVEALLANPDERVRRQRAGPARAAEFSIDRFIAAFDERLERLIAGRE